tara:strand:+ start:372 stop:1529 length:1158 start_codon:yes stop_codon:yes gene_type:complete
MPKTRFSLARSLPQLVFLLCISLGLASPAAHAQPIDQTITIDPAASQAISIESPDEDEGTLAEVSGPVSDALEEAIPQTGNQTIDSSLSTFVNAVGGLLDTIIAHLPQLIIAVIILFVTAFLASFISRQSRKVSRGLRLKSNLQDLLQKFVYILAWFLGLVTAAGIVFPGLGMGELVASAGLASIAIGFAFQDIFENFLAGILIIWRFPFDDGDYIEVPSVDVEGKVEEVQIRMTLIRDVSGELILVPNSTIFKNVVRVLTDRDTRRITVICGIAYGEDVAEGRAVIKEAVESCDSVHKNKPVEIFAQAFGSSSIDFEVTWWTGPTPIDQRRSRDEVVEKVKAALDSAGIEIPYPYRTLVFSKNEPDIIEAISGRTGSPSRGGND